MEIEEGHKLIDMSKMRIVRIVPGVVVHDKLSGPGFALLVLDPEDPDTALAQPIVSPEHFAAYMTALIMAAKTVFSKEEIERAIGMLASSPQTETPPERRPN